MATVSEALRAFLATAPVGGYLAIQAYLDRLDDASAVVLRQELARRTGLQTTFGWGPRFLHSTGQAYKGGPNSGVFLQLTADDPIDIDVPGHSYSFGVVKAAQARGDLDVLVERGRRALRVHVKDVDAGLAEFARAVDEALGNEL